MKMGGLLHLEFSEWVRPDGCHFPSSINKWKSNGRQFLDTHFKQETDKIYRKIK
jgi:hypothetical protein